MKYTVLHAHSEYSLLDGMSKCSDMAERYSKIGSTAGAITDHGSISGAVDFSKEMRDAGLKPILGCEFYVAKNSAKIKQKENAKLDHQVILAKNLKGWKTILNLVSISNKPEHYYYKPRIDIDILKNILNNNQNVISFSGHLGSILANAITDGDKLLSNWKKVGVAKALEMQDMFGKGNFFIEIQLIDSKINTFAGVCGNALREIAKEASIPCVATPDAHYCERINAEDQRVLLATFFKKSIPQIQKEIAEGVANRSLITFFRSDNYHIPSFEDMKEFHTDEELENTNLIADMCEDYSILNPPQPPEFKCPKGMSPEKYLRLLCREGWNAKMSHIQKGTEQFKQYGERVNHELEVFTSLGLSSYFLIVRDILEYVRSRGCITGIGRGSAAGCMVSYLLDITQVDPIKYDLIFERFYNAGRSAPGKVSWPDIDFDIPNFIRDDTVNYIIQKYGKENVAPIITFQTLKGKAALTRVMASKGNISFEEQKRITKHLPDEAKVSDELKDIEEEYGYSSSILWALEHNREKFKEWCYIGENNKLEGKYAKIFEQAIRLEHTKIISGKHAAGVVISKSPVSDICPMVADKDGEHMVAGFEGPSCEDVGLLKLDCLAIRGLDKVMDVVSIVAGE